MAEWISVKDRLPDCAEPVLISHSDGDMRYISIADIDPCGMWSDQNYEIIYTVTHWMPLPEPPKEDA